MAELSLRGLRKSFGDTEILKSLDLDVKDGEFMVFVGPSGCGKSTTLRLIAGLEEASGGDIRIGGRSILERPPAERGVAMVFQSYALYPHMTVADNLGFPLKMQGEKADAIRRQVGEVAEVLQITPLLDRLPRQLSGGQRQRVAIGRAIVRRPQVFLFDEPLSNLDASLRVQMRLELARLHRELGTTMVYVTHDQVEAMTLGQRIAVFNGGRLEQVGAPLDLFERPANAFVAGFLGSPRMNLVAAASWPGAPAGAAQLGVRPEHWELANDGRAMRLEHVEHLGDAVVAYGRLDDGTALTLRQAPGPVTLNVGAELRLRPLAGKAHWFDAQGRALREAA
jgi:multiple sugar transport system ATP-binding protein